MAGLDWFTTNPIFKHFFTIDWSNRRRWLGPVAGACVLDSEIGAAIEVELVHDPRPGLPVAAVAPDLRRGELCRWLPSREVCRFDRTHQDDIVQSGLAPAELDKGVLRGSWTIGKLSGGAVAAGRIVE